MENLTINQRIKLIRQQRKISQEQLAEVFGLSRSTYARREHEGKITAEDIKKLCEFFDLDPYFLLYGKDNPRIIRYLK